jgi:bifunctional N-acetylglucosamine-1-phosphate-uridyltransferase/glucosamine-1-phosphate-acetyltransferase GlmU-like protein
VVSTTLIGGIEFIGVVSTFIAPVTVKSFGA